jgi:hypothetical protein
MQPLEPLDQLTVDAFVAAVETCRDEGIELPETVWAIAQSPEHHVETLSEMAKQHPQLHTAYRTARKLLRQAEGERNKRMSTNDRTQVKPLRPSSELVFTSPTVAWEEESISTSKSESTPPQAFFQPQLNHPSLDPVQSIVYRYTLPETASPQAAIAFSKQVEAIRQSNPDWVVTFDHPNPGEADAIVLIRKDEHYAATHAAYLANRTLNQVVGPALNRIFGHASFNFPMSS